MSIDQLAERQVVRYGELEPDWDAFADSQVEGRRRAQYRLIGVGGSGKPDPHALPAGGFHALHADRTAGPGRLRPYP